MLSMFEWVSTVERRKMGDIKRGKIRERLKMNQ